MIRRDVVVAARGWLGTPYAHQASLRGVGCDCLGLLRGVWRELVGAEPDCVPPYTRDWAEAGRGEVLLETAARHLVPVEGPVRPGDVLLFRWRAHLPAKHCAIAAAGRASLRHCLPPRGEGGLSGAGGRMGGVQDEADRSIRHAPLPARGAGGRWVSQGATSPDTAWAEAALADTALADAALADTALADTMIHAHDGACVTEVALTPFWLRHLAGHFAFPDLEAAP